MARTVFGEDPDALPGGARVVIGLDPVTQHASVERCLEGKSQPVRLKNAFG